MCLSPFRGMGSDAHCIDMESNGLLAPFWEWLDKAVYEGQRIVHERPLDLWGAVVSWYIFSKQILLISIFTVAGCRYSFGGGS